MFGGAGAQPESTLRKLTISALSGCSAVLLTHPIDTVKVRMQTAAVTSGSMGVFGTANNLLKTEGPLSFYKGLSASLLRQATYGTVRFGLYGIIKDLVSDKGQLPLYKKVFVSLASGAGGAFVGSPVDVVLVRMQADGKLPVEQRRNYKNAVDGLIRIVKEEGPLKLWRGSTPNVVRAMLMTAGQLASYDQLKEMLLHAKFKDDTTTHFTASTGAAIIAAVITCPADVIKTRLMNQSGGNELYTGAMDCMVKTLKNEGLRGFYKGFVPYVSRLAPQTIFTFLFLEQYTKLFDKIGFH